MPQETKIINAFALEQLKTHDKVLIAWIENVYLYLYFHTLA